MKVHLLLASVAAALVLGVTSVSAQECGQFLVCHELYAHSFGQGGEENRHPTPQPFHGECLICYIFDEEEEAWVPTGPQDCHSVCPSLREEEQQAFDQLIAAAASGNLHATLAAARLIPSRVSLHSERRALQILDCAGMVLGTLPLGDLFDTATEAFPDMGQSRKFAPTSHSASGVVWAASIHVLVLLLTKGRPRAESTGPATLYTRKCGSVHISAHTPFPGLKL